MNDHSDDIPIYVEPFEDCFSLIPTGDLEEVERQSWYVHKGVTICIRDFTGVDGNEAARIVALHSDWLSRTDKQEIRLLVDISGGIANKQAIDAFKKSAKKNAARYQKVAVVGATGVLEFYLGVVNRFSQIGGRPFRTRGEAMDWLAES